MNFYDIRERFISSIIYLANFDRLKIIYYIALTVYIVMKAFFKKDVSPYELFFVFPGLYLAGYMLKYADDEGKKYGLIGYIILYMIYYFIVLLLSLYSINFILQQYFNIKIPYI